MLHNIDFSKYGVDGVKPEYALFIVAMIETRICDSRYAHWKTRPTPQQVARAQCFEFSKKVQEQFPHLKLERGFYVTTDGEDEYPAEHWWLVDVDGSIIDPSKIQFYNQNGRYSLYDDHEFKAMIGRCPNCGLDIYEDEDYGGVCSEECAESYAAYLDNEVRSLSR